MVAGKGSKRKKAEERSKAKRGSGFRFLYTYVKREGTLRHSHLYRDVCLNTYTHIHATVAEIFSDTLSAMTPFRDSIIKIREVL